LRLSTTKIVDESSLNIPRKISWNNFICGLYLLTGVVTGI